MFTLLLDIKGSRTVVDVTLFPFGLGVIVHNGQIGPNKPFFSQKISNCTLIRQVNIKNKASFLMGVYYSSSICKTAGRQT